MATKIINMKSDWTPVKIEIDFTTREQLAVFLQVMSMLEDIPKIIKDDPYSSLAVDLLADMSSHEISDVLNSIIDLSVWEQLQAIAEVN
jgi:hypothetical protein